MSRGRKRKSPSQKTYISEKTLSKSVGTLKGLQEELRAEQQKKAKQVEEPEEREQ